MAEERKVVFNLDLSEAIRALMAYRDSMKKGEGEASEFEQAVAKINQELEEQIKLERKQATEIKKLQDRLKELVELQQKSTDPKRQKEYSQQIRKTTTALNALTKVQKGYAANISKLEKELGKAEKAQKKFADTSKKSFRDLLDGASDAVPQVDKIKGLLTGLGRATVPTAIITGIVAIGASALDVSVQLSKIAEQIRGLTGLTQSQALEQAGAIKSLADTYNIDLNTAITAANTASKNFGVSFGQAVQTINEGLSGGLRFSEEYLENLKEYPSALGLTITSLEDFNALVLLQQQEGFFNDKLIDTVKEFEISIRELTKPTREAFGQAGLAGALGEFEAGTLNARQLLELTGKRMNELGADSKQVGVLLADVFRSAGEDGVVPLLRVLGDLDGNLQRAKTSMEELGEAERNLFEAQKNLNDALASDDVKTITDGFTNAKAATIGWIAELIKANDTIGEFFANLIPGVGILKSLRTAYRGFTGDTDAFTLGFERANEAQDINVAIQRRIIELRKLDNAGINASIDAIEKQANAIANGDKVTKDNLKTLESLKSALDNFPSEPKLPVDPDIEVDPNAAKETNDKIKEALEKAAREEEVRLRLKAQIEIKAAGGSGTEEGLNLLEGLAKKDFEARAKELNLNATSLEQGLKNISNDFNAQREALRKRQADKELADQKALNEAKIADQKAAFEKAVLFVEEQLAREEEIAQRRFLTNSLAAGTNLEAQQRAAEQFQQESFDAELRFLDNIKLLKQNTNQSTIDEAKRINDILLKIQEDRLEVEIQKEMEATERRKAIRESLLSGATQIASAISQVIQQNLDNELAAVEGNKEAEEAIRKKFAERQKRIQLVQAVINVAQGVTAALGSAPPPANFILSALTAAAGAIQIAAIANQRFAEGGFTGNKGGRKDDTGHVPVGIVHAGEHVSPKRIVDDPVEGKMVQYLESVRLGKPNTALLEQYAKSKGILPDISIGKPLYQRPEIPVLSGKTIQDSAVRHIEIKSGRVDIDYSRLARMIGEENDSDYQSDVLFKLLREQQNSNIALRSEVADLKQEIKRLR